MSTSSDELVIETVPIDSVKPLRRNPRRGDVDRVRRSFRRWGQYVPIVVRQETAEIVKGNHTWQAAKEEGHDTIAVIWRSIATDSEAEELAIGDNVASDAAEWDLPLLSEILQGATIELDATLLDPIQIEQIHVGAASIAASEAGKALGEQADPPLPAPPRNPITKEGDIWELGDHRLLCGDSRDVAAVKRVVAAAGGPLDLLFSSPPYNADVPYDDHDDKRVSWETYGGFLRSVLEAWLPELADGRAVGWNVGVAPETYPAHQLLLLEDLGLRFYRMIAWDKMRQGMPTFHHTEKKPVARNWVPDYSFELIYVVHTGKRLEHGAKIDVIDPLARYTVLPLAPASGTRDLPSGGNHSSGGANPGLNRAYDKAHPAVFPVRLPEVFIRHLTAPGELVADCFMGAGSTMLAAQRLERRAVGIELTPAFCDVAIERWETATGEKANRPRSRRKRAAKTKEKTG